jgi:hypothetical protein
VRRGPLRGDTDAIHALYRVLHEHGFWGAGGCLSLLDLRVPPAAPGLAVMPSIGSGAFRLSVTLRTATTGPGPLFVVHDIAGRRVWRGAAEPGGGMLRGTTWNGRDERGEPVRPGVYFASVDADRERWTRTIVVRR